MMTSSSSAWPAENLIDGCTDLGRLRGLLNRAGLGARASAEQEAADAELDATVAADPTLALALGIASASRAWEPGPQLSE